MPIVQIIDTISQRDTRASQPTHALLQNILHNRQLSAYFQPIILLEDGGIYGYEGLIRGPINSPLHSPIHLFKAAQEHGFTVDIEHLCRRIVLERFQAQALPGKLFLNVSPECLVQNNARLGETLDFIHELGIDPHKVIIELTEYQPTHDYQLLKKAVMHYRSMGFKIAIDDLGEGFSSLRLWSELEPEFVKIDMHFIQGIDKDPIKRQFVRSIQTIASQSGARIVAEGIETKEELKIIKELGITCGQGYHIAKPDPYPSKTITEELAHFFTSSAKRYPASFDRESNDIRRIMKTPQWVTPDTLSSDVERIFLNNPKLKCIPVIENQKPLGIINRYNMIAQLSRPFQRELYQKRACTVFMDHTPLIIDHQTTIQEASHLIIEADPDHLLNGLIVTENDDYIGIASGPDLMREITKMQIEAARYANPLTQLPGNVPINQRINHYLSQNLAFVACYCDLNHFKPYNDIYGYQQGDEVIQLTGQILSKTCCSNLDYVGHIGGDDFIILFRSDDWEQKCLDILDQFAASITPFFSESDLERAGYFGEDRQGRALFHPLVSLALGAVAIPANTHMTHHHVAIAASEAKKQAKRTAGNQLYLERRTFVTS